MKNERTKQVNKFMVTVRRKSTHFFEVEAKNRNQARKLVEDRVIGTSMDCRENYGGEINDLSHHGEHHDYISTVEAFPHKTKTKKKGAKK